MTWAWEEDRAFWAFAAVEVLRSTGIRIEELTELSHHSLIQYRLPSTGEMVPLLQIAPSKTDAERLLVVSPELADVLSAIISRVRGPTGAIPLVRAYDRQNETGRRPQPLLFQRRVGFEHRAISSRGHPQDAHRRNRSHPADRSRDRRTAAIHPTRLSHACSSPTPCSTALPPHIAQVIAGHRDINVTIGYKAVYPDEAIQAHLAFLARRRALRPTDEYRVTHRRRMAAIPRPLRTSQGLHRHLRTRLRHRPASMNMPVSVAHCSGQTPLNARLVEIRDNLQARIAEAEREGWLGEVEGLQVSLAGAEDKLAQIDKRSRTTESTSVDLGTPSLPTKSWPSNE